MIDSYSDFVIHTRSGFCSCHELLSEHVSFRSRKIKTVSLFNRRDIVCCLRNTDVQVWDISLESATPLYRAGGGVTLTAWSPDERNLFAATPTSLFRWDNFHIMKFNYIYNKEVVHS